MTPAETPIALAIMTNPPVKFCGAHINPLDGQFPMRRCTPYFPDRQAALDFLAQMQLKGPEYIVVDQVDWLQHVSWNWMSNGPYASQTCLLYTSPSPRD